MLNDENSMNLWWIWMMKGLRTYYEYEYDKRVCLPIWIWIQWKVHELVMNMMKGLHAHYEYEYDERSVDL